MSAVRHVFEKRLKPKIFEMRNSGCTSIVNKETIKTVQALQSYLLSIVNPEWAVAMAHKIAQEFPTGELQMGWGKEWGEKRLGTSRARVRANICSLILNNTQQSVRVKMLLHPVLNSRLDKQPFDVPASPSNPFFPSFYRITERL